MNTDKSTYWPMTDNYYHDFEILKMALYHTPARIQMEMEVQFTVEQAPELGEIISFSGLEAAINGGEEIEFAVASSSHGGTGYSVVARNCKGYVKDFRFNHCGLVGVFYASADKL